MDPSKRGLHISNPVLSCRLRRSPQEEGEAPALPWWCDPAQPGYAFYNNQAIKDWCEANARTSYGGGISFTRFIPRKLCLKYRLRTNI